MLVQKYYDGELDSVESAEYENHRRTCERCRLEDMQFASVFEALDGLPAIEPSRDFNSSVMARVDISRYRVGALQKAFRVLGRVLGTVPNPVRILAAVAAVFTLFITAYRPLLDFLISIYEEVHAFLGSSLFLVRMVGERSIKYLGTAKTYNLVGETLLRSIRRTVFGMQPYQLGLTAAALAIMLILLIMTVRTAQSKGETNV